MRGNIFANRHRIFPNLGKRFNRPVQPPQSPPIVTPLPQIPTEQTVIPFESPSPPVEPSSPTIPSIPAQRGHTPSEELVINYIRGISKSSGTPFNDVKVSVPVGNYAKKMGVDISLLEVED